jgi:hypothetical protein
MRTACVSPLGVSFSAGERSLLKSWSQISLANPQRYNEHKFGRPNSPRFPASFATD